jgi:hypothetical protein
MWDFVMDKSGAGAGFLRELRFPLPIYIPCWRPSFTLIQKQKWNTPTDIINHLWRHFRAFRFTGSRKVTIQKAFKGEWVHGTDNESCHVGAEWRDAMYLSSYTYIFLWISNIFTVTDDSNICIHPIPCQREYGILSEAFDVPMNEINVTVFRTP